MRQNIIFISSAKFDHTPVLNYTKKEFEKTYNCTKIEYKYKHVIPFLFKSLGCILNTNKKAAIFFIGAQSLPLLFIFQFFFKNKIYYWALESYKFKLIKSPLVIKILFIEYLINWKRIFLFVPSQERLDFFSDRKFKKSFIVSNCAPLGIPFIKRDVKPLEKIKFVMYGRLNNQDIFLLNFIDFCTTYSNKLELHLIGWDFKYDEYIKDKENIFYHGYKDHNTLIKMLDQFHYSIIGYRPYDYNNKFCAPNKLYEAFSLSLPVIVNNSNPSLTKIIEKYNCGIIWDFENLQSGLLEILKNKMLYSKLNENCYNSYLSQYNIENELLSVKVQSIENVYT